MTPNITNLNEDCLLKVIEKLSFEDQLSLWQAAANDIEASNLSDTLNSCWQRQSRHIITTHTLTNNLDTLEVFLECISGTVKDLELRYLTRSQLNLLRNHRFIHTTRIDFKANEDGNFADQDISLLVSVFPQVTSLQLSGSLSGLHIASFENLLELDIHQCWYLSLPNIEQICKSLKLKKLITQCTRSEADKFVQALTHLTTLEELELEVELSQQNVRKILSLPKLRFLCYSIDEEASNTLADIAELRASDILGATFRECFSLCTTDSLRKLRNLHRITIIEDEGWFTVDLLQTVSSLTEFHLVDTTIWHTAAEMWELVSRCPSLELINIFRSYVSSFEFFDNNKKAMDKALNGRSKPLHLHLQHTNLDHDLITQYFQHSNLKVSFQSKKITYPCLSPLYIQLELKPLEL